MAAGWFAFQLLFGVDDGKGELPEIKISLYDPLMQMFVEPAYPDILSSFFVQM